MKISASLDTCFTLRHFHSLPHTRAISSGVDCESNTTRIGTEGTQIAVYIAELLNSSQASNS